MYISLNWDTLLQIPLISLSSSWRLLRYTQGGHSGPGASGSFVVSVLESLSQYISQQNTKSRDRVVKAKQSFICVKKTKIPVHTRGYVSSAALHFSFLGLRHIKSPQRGFSPSLIVHQKAMGGCPAGSWEGVGPILMYKFFISFLKQPLSQWRKTVVGLGLPLKQLALGELLLSTGSASQHRSQISPALCVQCVGSRHPQDFA